ncbi:MAG TPA: O-antigen ligase family protein [Roseomonas sp.]|nr:O-antigen ligase family protein [Roseomonas sp.]
MMFGDTLRARTERSPISRFLGAVEVSFCFFAISLYSGGYIPIPVSASGAELKAGETNPFNTVAMSLLLCGTLVAVALRWRRVLFVARHGGAINIFLLLVLLSVTWSYYPVISLKRFLVLLQTVLLGYYLVARFPMHRIIQLWASALFFAMLASLLAALAFPKIGIMSAGEVAGTWRGVFAHKSSLGAAAMLAALCSGWVWVHEPRRRLRHSLALLLCLFLAFMSSSKTAQVAIMLIIALSLCLPLLQLPGLARVWATFILAVGAICGVALLALFFADIMEALGKDPSLTGRVPVWLILLDLASNRLGLGYGYSAFFIDGNPDSDLVSGLAGWTINEAHNAYIEMVVQLGIPGLVIALWALGESAYRAFTLQHDAFRPWLGFAIIYTLTFSATNLAETILFRAGDMHCVMFTAIYAVLRIEAARRVAVSQGGLFPPRGPTDPLYAIVTP